MKSIQHLDNKIDGKILLYLAKLKADSDNRHNISKKLKMSYSNVYNHMKQLLSNDLIEVVKTEKGKKNPKIQVDFYRITARGLIFALSYLESFESTDFDVIANNNKDKFLVFEEWDSFTSAEKEKIKKLFEDNVKTGILFSHLWPKIAIGSMSDDDIKWMVDESCFGFPPLLRGTIKRNPKLRNYTLQDLRKKITDTESLLKELKIELKSLEA